MIRIIGRILKYGTLISTYALIGSVLLQIFARFFLANTPSWTEEASRLFFIYAIAFSSGLALKDNYYVALDLFFERFSTKTQKLLKKLIPGFNFLLFSIIAVFAIQFMILGIKEYSPSMKISMAYVFFSMVIMAVSMTYYAFLDLKKNMK